MSNALAMYANFDQTNKIAHALSQSELLPPHFRGKPSNVLIALEFAHRNDIAPFAAMQSMFVISGKVGMTAAMAISLARKHNVWKSIRYVSEGAGNDMQVTAIAKNHDDTDSSSTVTMKMANDAGWTKNAVWRSIPEQMLKYRAAVFLIRSHYPEVLFGMYTKEELEDISIVNVTPEPEPKVITAPANKEEKEDAKFKLKKDYLFKEMTRFEERSQINDYNHESFTKMCDLVIEGKTIKDLDDAYKILVELKKIPVIMDDQENGETPS